MKATRFAAFLFSGLAVVALASCSKEKEAAPSEPAETAASEKHSSIIPGEAKVFFSEEMTALVEEAARMGNIVTKSSALNDLVSELGITSMEREFPYAGEYEERTRREGLHRWYKITFSEEIPVTKAGEQLLSLPGVDLFVPSYRVRSLARTPNDSYWSYMWGLYSPANGINVQDVWDKYTTGNPDVVVGVVDGGIQLNHPDLKWNCLTSGHYNYVDRSTTIVPHDHGSHVAGTIAAVSNNKAGVAGIAGGDYAAGKRGVSLLSLQVFKTQGNTDVSNGFETAIKEGADRGAVISQNSWGYYFDDNDDGEVTGEELENARYTHNNIPADFKSAVNYFIKYAGCDNQGNQKPDSPMKGGVVIFAGGNEDIPYGPPANYEPVIAVGATASNGSRADFSNYGDWVDICAPGVDIASTVPTNDYAFSSGTSMACPHVSGVAALMVSYFGGPGYTNAQLKEALLGGARQIASSTGSKPVGPMLDAMGSFLYGDSEDPVRVTDYTASVSGNSVKVSLTTNGNFSYRVYVAKNRSLIDNLDPASPAAGVSYAVKTVSNPDVLSGEEMTIQVPGLEFQTTYYVTVVGANAARRFAEAGPVKQVVTTTNNPPVLGGNAKIGTFHQYENVSLPLEIYEPDGNSMTVTYTKTGRAELVQEQGAWVFKLNCQTSQEGVFKLNVTAKDEFGLSASREYTYEVLKNVAPVVSAPFDNIQLAAADEKIEVEVASHFSDEDGEPLSFTVTTPDAEVITAEMDENNKLTVTANARGVCEVRVMATDAMLEHAVATFMVLVRDPDTDFSIYPESSVLGPSLTVITGTAEADTDVRLVTSAGAAVYRYHGMLSAYNPVTIDTSALSPGVYTLVATYNGTAHKKTLIKK